MRALLPAIHTLLAVVALTVVGRGVVWALSAFDQDAAMGTTPLQWAILATHAVLVLLIVFGVLRFAKLTPAQLGWSAFVPSRDLPWAVAAFAGAALFPVGITLLDAGPQAVLDGVLTGPLPMRFAFIAIGVIAAFAEESVFRGCLQPLLVRKLGAAGGILVTSVIFSLYHLPTHPLAFVGRLLTGLAYGATAHRTKALWAGAIGHFLSWVVLGAL